MNDIVFQPLGDYSLNSESLSAVADIDPRLTRTHYFDGRLLTAEDLTRDQTYLDQRLRELGRVLGSGVMGGLELTLDKSVLTLRPGQALTPAGRVLELGKQLQLNLADSTLRKQLNSGKHNYLNRSLYAVVLRQVEVGTEVAEVFPQDLGSRRDSQYSVSTECVQLALVPLGLALASQSHLQIRARLMREFYGNDSFDNLIPEDAVALGVLAVEENTAKWLDSELLRRPLRTEPSLGDWQADLSRQYEKLLTDVLVSRGNQRNDFHAADYFSLLPPVGTLPRDAIDPASGRQGYFPEHYQVAIAPVRQSDVELIRAESLDLPPINLLSQEPVDIMVLVPLSNLDFGHYAARLERGYDPGLRRLPQIDLMRLKLYPTHVIDTDKSAWTDIMSRLGDSKPFYVRRPSRAAETAISGIVLALGTEVPEPGAIELGPADNGGLVQDENTVFLNRLNLKTLAELRPPQTGDSSTAFEKLLDNFGKDAALVQQCAGILLRIERQYDSLVWQTLLQLADARRLEDFLKGLLQSDADATTPKAVVNVGGELGLDSNLLNQWADLVP